jgi:hypothetical protein
MEGERMRRSLVVIDSSTVGLKGPSVDINMLVLGVVVVVVVVSCSLSR